MTTPHSRQKTCARCDAATEPPSGRFCAVHRAEHGAHLTAQLTDILAGHKVRVEAARAKSVALMARTCGHPAEALAVVAGEHFCSACPDASAPSERGEMTHTPTPHSRTVEPYVSRRMLRFLVWLPPFVLLTGLWIGVLVGEHNGC